MVMTKGMRLALWNIETDIRVNYVVNERWQLLVKHTLATQVSHALFPWLTCNLDVQAHRRP